MKFKFIYALFTLILCAVLFIASKNGRAFSQGLGNTGAPGDETNSNGTAKTCQSCHNTSSVIQVTLDIEVMDDSGNVTTEYIPDEIYDIKVTVNSVGPATPAGYGFQLLCLKAPSGQSGADSKSFSGPASNVRIATASSNGRQYAEHKGPSSTNEFMVKWTAPAAGTGTITFYSCGNGVNLNDNSGGDNAACDQLQLTEAEPLSDKDFAGEVLLNVFPNPVEDILNLEINSRVSGIFEMRIFNLFGQLVKTGQIDLQYGENRKHLDVSDLASGNYFLQLTNDGKMVSRKLLKL